MLVSLYEQVSDDRSVVTRKRPQQLNHPYPFGLCVHIIQNDNLLLNILP